jgi:hypothetical protein
MKILTGYVVTLVKSVIMIFAVVGVVSCQKNKNDDPAPPPAPTVEAKGYWTGIYTTTGTLAQDKSGMLINANGTARLYALDVSMDTTLISPLAKTDGTWILNGTTLEVSYANSGGFFTTSAIVNSVQKTMIGTWAKNGIVKGTLSMTK